MKTILKTLLVFLLLVLSSGITLDAQSACPRGQVCTVFICVNGIGVKDEVAWNDEVRGIGVKFFKSNPNVSTNYVKFDSAYNQSYGKLADIFAQSSFQWELQAIENFLSDSSFLKNNPLNNLKLTFALWNYSFDAKRVTADLIVIGDKIHSWQNLGYRVVLVGHSQGSFFTNEAYEIRIKEAVADKSIILPDTNLLSIVNIASPSRYVADGRGKYTTQCNDIIRIVPGALPGNMTDPSMPCTSFASALFPFNTSLSNLIGFAGVQEIVSKLWHGYEVHLLSTYTADGSATQKQIFAQMVDSLSTTTTLTSSNSLVLWLPSTPGYYTGGMVNTECRVGGWGDYYYCLIKPSFVGLPKSASRVILRLYKYAEGSYRSQIFVDRLTSDFTSGTKWNTRPSFVNIKTLSAPVDGQWYEIDITDFYNAVQSGAYPNYGIQLRPVSTSVDTQNTFWSPLYTDNALRPQLVITSTSTEVAPPANIPPTITLSGANPLTVVVGTSFVEPGYIGDDPQDGNITSRIVVTSTVNTALLGTYTITYSLKDSGGLSATPVVRTVVVSASGSRRIVPPVIVPPPPTGTNTPPVITLQGSNPATFFINSTFYELGYTAIDPKDGNISSKVIVSGIVNTKVIGTYVQTYNVKNSSGLSATPVTRTVNVIAPILSGQCLLNGASTDITVTVGSSVRFSVTTSGGFGTIHYSWAGFVAGDVSSVYTNYTYVGRFDTSVLISDSSQQVMLRCPQVLVATTAPAPYAVSCYITPSSIRFGSSATYVANASGGYPPYTFYLPGTLAYQSAFNQGMTITPNTTGVIGYEGLVQDSHGQVIRPSCYVTVNK